MVHLRSIRRRDWGHIHFELVYGEWPAPVITKEEMVRGDIEKLKGFLNSIRKQQADYLSLQEELRRLEFEAHNLRGVQMGEKVQSGHCANLEEIVEKVEDYHAKVNKAYLELIEKRNRGEELISKEEDGVRRAVLRRRYIQCERWGDIAEKMNFAESNIYKIHGEALVDLEPFLRESDFN